ncbi:MAG TPA: hypothetical protein VEX43_19595, partial [Chthoniobacterales bacterium]|nr:hypothetical protein [Chthoniobacterales bacterium]
ICPSDAAKERGPPPEKQAAQSPDDAEYRGLSCSGNGPPGWAGNVSTLRLGGREVGFGMVLEGTSR